MPCFNTHWLVAMKCTKDGGLPESVTEGFRKYKDITIDFKKYLTAEIHNVVDKKTCNAFLNPKDGGLKKTFDEYNKQLKDPSNYNDITCFSAYMLGACGPDFWTVPTGTFLNTAGIHFNLGHYNRTHRQFQVAIKRWQKMEKTPGNEFQIQVEQAYFYGMATHIAADCVIHQLVNVSAGAYDLLKPDHWTGEQTSFPKLWNTHNKVENYWDSYIRYRYLGDTGHLFDDKPGVALDNGNWMTVLNFQTTEMIIGSLEKHISDCKAYKNSLLDKKQQTYYLEKIAAQESLIKELKKDKNKFKIETPFNLPRVFCDRMNAPNGGLQPFMHKIVVDKNTGAYPGVINRDKTMEGVIFNKAIDEAKSSQMNPKEIKINGKKEMTYSEGIKLTYFDSASNKASPSTSFNYLNYKICPDLDKVKRNGWDVFYHTNALGSFLDSAMKAGKEFIICLSKGMTSKDQNIGLLGKFWNLDTGLGLEVVYRPSKTPHEVITELRFIHINNAVTTPVNYKNRLQYLKARTESASYIASPLEEMSFKTRKAVAFEKIEKVEEADKDKYFEWIELKPAKNTPLPRCRIEDFFVDGKETKNQPRVVESAVLTPVNVFSVHKIRYRLNLLMTVPIAQFPANETVGFELRNYDMELFKPAADIESKDWLKKSKLIDRIETQVKDKNLKRDRFERKNGLCTFKSRLFMNFEKEKYNDRIITKGDWDNVIEYDKHKKQYSRNYCVGTGRKGVLHPSSTSGGTFNAMDDFEQYINVSPTEQVFFSLHPLVRTNREWYDMLSKELVSVDQLQELIRIDCLGFVKIVLFYELTTEGGTQLKECYIDGLHVAVGDK